MRASSVFAALVAASVLTVPVAAGAAQPSTAGPGCTLKYVQRHPGQRDVAFCHHFAANSAGAVTVKQQEQGKSRTIKLGSFHTGPHGNARVHFRVARKVRPGVRAVRFAAGGTATSRALIVRAGRK